VLGPKVMPGVDLGIKAIRTELGHLDVLVNSAGIVGEFPVGTPFEERLTFNAPSVSPLSYVRSVYETNVFGVIAVTQAMLPLLRESAAGRIVNVRSSSGSLTLNANPESRTATSLALLTVVPIRLSVPPRSSLQSN
jgi:NAD(P)-dependent dehydrogenase (short-subunit alcohol dehydrogenase family)